ncbi:MAG: sugar transferase [Eubacterium sp.]
MIYQKYIKRVLDVTLSATAIIVLSPVMGVTALLVRKKLGSPVIFKQKRPGKDEKIFTMYKFRTMTDERDCDGNLMPDSVRLTQFGKTLRSTSLDELPELFNILKGDMSIVGPRPQLVRDMIFMTKQQRKRHSVFPGLTGWSQVNGRNIITWEEKIDFDLEYLQKISFRNDLKIVLKTVIKVLIKDGINMKNMDTAEDFGDYLLRNKAVTNNEYEYLIQQSRKLVNE